MKNRNDAGSNLGGQGERWKNKGEFLSGFRQTDRLCPVITLVFYHGEEEYDGCRDLYGMLKSKQEMEPYQEFISNYRLNLITLQDLREEHFRTGLRDLIGVMKCRNSKQQLEDYMQEHQERLCHLDEETADTMIIMLNIRDGDRWKARCKKDGGVNMCLALEQMIEEGKEQGIEQGIEHGIRALIETCREFGASREDTVSRLVQKFSITPEQAEVRIEKYWI